MTPGGDGQQLRVVVAGGGPVGLTFAALTAALADRDVHVTVLEQRWTQQDGTTRWAPEHRRRRQIVTLQSRHWANLPVDAQAVLFPDGDAAHVWPVGPDSVNQLPPRNIAIADLEDRLLHWVATRTRTTLIADRYDPVRYRDLLDDAHLLVIADGAKSPTLARYRHQFGDVTPGPFTLNGNPVEDTCLGIQVRTGLPPAAAVLLTVSQNRYLLNPLHGEGFLNIRLTASEADLLQHHLSRARAVDVPLDLLRADGIRDVVTGGLALFDVNPADVTYASMYTVRMQMRPRFTARITTPTGATPGTYAAVIGDAAIPLHFWPGRGLNSGIAAATSLAATLSHCDPSRPLRDADFTPHEAVMAMLQHRHTTRAWHAAVATDLPDPAQIRDVIAAAHTGPPADSDPAHELVERILGIKRRLEDRLPHPVGDDVIVDAVRRLDPKTAATLLASQSWNAHAMGGPEVDVLAMHAAARTTAYRPHRPPAQPAE